MRRILLFKALLVFSLSPVTVEAASLSNRTIRESHVIVESRVDRVLSDPTREVSLFGSPFVIPESSQVYLTLETRTNQATRVIVHLEPVRAPAVLEQKIPEKDWANPERRHDFRAVLSLEPGTPQRHTLDLRREIFEAFSKQKLPFDPAGLSIARVAVEVNQPADPGFRVRIRNQRIIRLTSQSLRTELDERAARLHERWRALPAKSTLRKTWKSKVERLLSEVEAFRKNPEDPEKWHSVSSDVDALLLASHKWRLPDSADTPYLVGIETALRRISGRHPLLTFQGQLAQTLELEAAANESECFQLVLLPSSQSLADVRIEAGALRAEGVSESIPSVNIQFFHQIEQRVLPSPGTSMDWAGWMPDALLPIQQSFNVEFEETKPIWVCVQTPETAAAGEYQGLLRVRPSNAPETALRLRLRVHDFAIPRRGRFRTQGHLSLEGLQDWYGQSYSAAIRKSFSKLLMEHRMTPTSQYSARLSPHPEDIPWIADQGGNVFLIGGYSGRPLEPEIIQPAYDWLVEHGYVDQSIIYIGDETDDFEEVRRKAVEIRRKWPRIRIMVGGSKPRPELIGFVDVWDPITWGGAVYDFDPRAVEEALRRGEEVFWYTCVGPRHPFANVYNDHPLTAIRALWWQAWKYGVTGFEYWWFNWWQPNLSLSKKNPPWPRGGLEQWSSRSFEWANGDGLLVFPGSAGEALPSLRLSVMRDAIEDWEVLFLLQRAVELADEKPAIVTKAARSRARRLLSVPPQITTRLQTWSRDPSLYLNTRHEVYAVLSDLIHDLGRQAVVDYAAAWEEEHRDRLKDHFEERVRNSRAEQ